MGPTGSLQENIAQRAQKVRIAQSCTQEELALRAGVALSTLKRFEQTGEISLSRLIKIAMALGALSEFDLLFPMPEARTLDDYALQETRKRVRNKSTDHLKWKST